MGGGEVGDLSLAQFKLWLLAFNLLFISSLQEQGIKTAVIFKERIATNNQSTRWWVRHGYHKTHYLALNLANFRPRPVWPYTGQNN